jgi:tetratricopeptide (TPR) repeat protein
VVASHNTTFQTAPTRFNELWNRRDYDGAERLARTLADSGRPSDMLSAKDGLAGIAIAHGKLHEGERIYAQTAEARPRVRGDSVNPHIDGYGHAMVDGVLRGDSARGIADLDAALRAAPVLSIPLEGDQSMYLALGYARLGAVAKAREVLNAHEARLDEAWRRGGAVFAARVRGSIALAEGKGDSAVAYFRSGDLEPDGLPTGNCPICTPLYLGLAFDRGGHADSARTYLTRYVEMNGNGRYFPDRFNLAPVLYRLGELYESAGDTKHATEYYGRFVDLWKNADPDLQPRVEEARKRMERMNRATR